MNKHNETTEDYAGFELGPIRPPSEAASLMLRVTRNCPWNKCKFCGLYRGDQFSIRPVEHIMRDIDQVRAHVDRIEEIILRNAGLRQLVEGEWIHVVARETEHDAWSLRTPTGGWEPWHAADPDAALAAPLLTPLELS